MPNWCENNLKIGHSDEDKIEKIKQTVDGNFKEPLLLQSLIPMPEELEGTSSPGDKPNWYDWRLENWGCKWDIHEYWTHEPEIELDWDRKIHYLELGFDSPWSPPVIAYQKLEKMGFYIYATYCEGGCDFVGRYTEGTDTTYSLDDVPKEDKELYDYVQSWRGED